MTEFEPRVNFRIPELGPVMQLAFVPKDWNVSLQFWTVTMGVGPFFISENIRVEKAFYRGEFVDLDFEIALGYWGDTQIELIRQKNDSPSIYQEWLRGGRRGMHHVCIAVDDIETAKRDCTTAKGVAAQEFLIAGGGAIYFEFSGAPFFVEVVQLPEKMRERNKRMREIAGDWNGENPIRPRLDLS